MENQTDVIVWANVIPCQLSVSLWLCLTLKNKASVWWYPAQVAGYPGESSRVTPLATCWRTKWHNANLGVATITLQICKCTTTVSLQHKTNSVLMCENFYLMLELPMQRPFLWLLRYYRRVVTVFKVLVKSIGPLFVNI